MVNAKRLPFTGIVRVTLLITAVEHETVLSTDSAQHAVDAHDMVMVVVVCVHVYHQHVLHV